MSEKIKKLLNNKYFIVALVALLIVLVIGTGTYAWLTWSSPNTTKLTVKIGNIADVIFDNGKEINTTSLAPVFTYDQGEKTSFSIVKRSTATSANIDYTITLNITSIAAELKVASFKYVLLNGNQVVRQGDFSSASSGGTISLSSSRLTDTRADFTFYIYIDGNTENNANMMNKEFKATINVSASEGSNTINAVQYITNLYTNASKTPATNNGKDYNTAPSVSLMNDRLGGTTTDLDGGNIRYYGANPNNYIYFNCSDYSNQTSSTCETWRIIGVFDGKLKITNPTKNDFYFPFDYDKNDDGTSTTYDSNWSTSTLQKLLNNGYYNNTIGEITYYFTDSSLRERNNTKNMSNIGLKNVDTRKLISSEKWYLGSNYGLQFANEVYVAERSNISCEDCNYDVIWNGNIALPYLSDFGYAGDFNACNVSTISSNCKGWMLFSSMNYWLLSIDTATTIMYYNFFYGNIQANLSSVSYIVLPTLYLIPDIKIVGGTGTSDNPYLINK